MPDTVEQLLASAEQRIRSQGFHSVSFRDLASELGIKSSSVHYHFPQKQDLGVAVIRRYRDAFFSGLENNTAQASNPDEVLAAFVAAYREALMGTGNICLCGILGAETQGLPEKVSQEVAGFLKENIAWLAERLDPAMDASARHATATGVVATLHGAMLLARAIGDLELFDEAVASLRP